MSCFFYGDVVQGIKTTPNPTVFFFGGEFPSSRPPNEKMKDGSMG